MVDHMFIKAVACVPRHRQSTAVSTAIQDGAETYKMTDPFLGPFLILTDKDISGPVNFAVVRGTATRDELTPQMNFLFGRRRRVATLEYRSISLSPLLLDTPAASPLALMVF